MTVVAKHLSVDVAGDLHNRFIARPALGQSLFDFPTCNDFALRSTCPQVSVLISVSLRPALRVSMKAGYMCGLRDVLAFAARLSVSSLSNA